jgi:hypothetical protein
MTIESNFINIVVLKKLLRGLKTKSKIIIIEAAVQLHIVLVPSVNIFNSDEKIELI